MIKTIIVCVTDRTIFLRDIISFSFFIIFFPVSIFISDNLKLSNNKFIKILQKFVFFNSFIALICLILYLFDISLFNTVFCDSEDEDDPFKMNTGPKFNDFSPQKPVYQFLEYY